MGLFYHCNGLPFSFPFVLLQALKSSIPFWTLSRSKCLSLCVSGSLVSGAVCVIVEEESPLLGKAGVQEVQQEDSGEGCGSTSVSAVF